MKIPAIVILALTLVGCSKMVTETSSYFDYVASTEGQAAMFRSNVVSYLASRNFTETAAPGGLTSWSGTKMPRMVTHWYSGTFSGSQAFLVKISETQIPRDRVQFTSETSWSLKGSAAQHERIRKQVSDFSKELRMLVAKQNAEQDGSASRGQPVGSETNRTPSAAGSGG